MGQTTLMPHEEEKVAQGPSERRVNPFNRLNSNRSSEDQPNKKTPNLNLDLVTSARETDTEYLGFAKKPGQTRQLQAKFEAI